MQSATTGPFDGSSSSDFGENAVIYTGAAVAGAGAVCMIATGVVLGVRKRKAREGDEVARGEGRKVSWDPRSAGFVF